MIDRSLFEFTAFLLSINLSRYFILAGGFFFFFYILFRKRWKNKKIQPVFPKKTDYFREILYSLITMCVFTVVAWVVIRSPLSEYTLRYKDIDAHGWVYWCVSVVLMIFLHDTYFYWAHRAMHHPKLFRSFHAVHHQSRNPSPWAAFAFHPLEAIVEAGVIFPINFLIPYHTSALAVFLLFMTGYNVYGHLGYELYPKSFASSKIGKWVNTSVSHNQHHEKFNGNYGLYFLFWDRWMKTLKKDYTKVYLKNK